MHAIWKEQYGDNDVSEQRLQDQKRTIIKNKLLSPLELQQLQVVTSPDSEQRVSPSTPKQHPSADTSGPTDESTSRTLPLPPVELPHNEQEVKVAIENLITTSSQLEQRLPTKKLRNTKELREQLKLVNKVIPHIQTDTITETNNLAHAAAIYIQEQIQPTKPRTKEGSVPPWKKRLQNQIKGYRKDISRLSSAMSNKGRLRESLISKYHLKERHIQTAIEDAKQRLIALAHRLKRYQARSDQYHQNNLFKTNPGRLYEQLKGKRQTQQTPDPQETKTFWESIWSKPEVHNMSARWLADIQKDHTETPTQNNIVISEADVRNKLRTMANWKAPGPDQLQTFWLKYLTSLHERLAVQLQRAHDSPDHLPSWLVTGRTTLIMKDPQKGTSPKNYRPITCLPTTWKLMSGIIADKIMAHMHNNNLLADEQKGARHGSRGTKDQLAIDKMVMKDSKKRRTNLAVAWIDYQKAYDSVPHSWILETLQLYKIAPATQKMIAASMRLWNTTLTCNNQILADIKIQCGIFQGDALSPLLFCIALNPLSELLRRTEFGYTVKSGHRIHHLLYMDDLKLYGKNENQINSLINTVKIFSEDIRMKFGLDKCARLIKERGKVKNTQGLQLDVGTMKDAPLDTGYKYLGILQSDDNLQTEVKTKARREYEQRVKQVLRSRLNGHNKMQAINAYAIPVISYTGGIIDWTEEEKKDLDRRTRKLLTMHKGLHPRADVDRLYIPRKAGGRGLRKIKDTIENEERNLATYIWNNTGQQMLKAVQQSGLWEKPDKATAEWRKVTLEETRNTWMNKPLHGQYIRQIAEATTNEAAFRWLTETGLKIETEALITAAQDQALPTKMIKAKIMKTSHDTKCRLCKEKDETVAHLLSACPKLAGSEYIRRHNEVAKILHHGISQHHNIPTTDRTWLHQPEAVTETDEVKILWDFEIRTDRIITARRPDIVVIDKTDKTATIIDVAVPNDHNIRVKEQDKVEKYQDLRLEIQRLWNVKAQVVPVVIGALGSTTPNFPKHLEKIPGKHRPTALVKAALLGSSHILRKTLDLPESG